jgi:hypothetical protein
MVDCDYCDASFEGEDAYLDHLADAHSGELGSIDKRRVEENSGGGIGSSIPLGPAILVGVIGFSLAIVVYVVVFMGGGGGTTGESGAVNGFEVSQMPTGQPYSGVHEHGTMTVTIDGQQVDFSQQRYQVAADPFHFEGGNGRVWHTHASGVTLEYALATLNIGLSENSVTYQGTTYRDGENANVTIQVNGEPVDPETYVLQGTEADSGEGGDQVRIVVNTTSQ